MKSIFSKIALVVAVLAIALSVTGSASAAITSYLTVGSTGPQVVELQTALESQGYLVMPAGTAKGYFGALTKTAVMKWQAAVGLPATGYFGPLSLAKFNSMSTGGSTTGGSTTGGSTTGGNTGSSSNLSGGDGDFSKFKVLGSPNSKDIDEGETKDVFGFEFEADDSDLLVERIDVVASSSNSNVEKPWKVIDEIAIVVDGDTIADIDASDEDNWDETSDINGEDDADAYRIRLEDVDLKVDEGDKVKVYVSVTASDDIDNDETGNWTIALDDDGIRARNAEGIDVYEGDSAAEKTFSIGQAEAGDLDITVRATDNKDMTVEVDEDNETTDVLLYTAEVESKTGDNTIEEVTVTIATTTGTNNGLSDFISTLYLYIDGEEVGSESVSDDDGSEAITFDDLDVTIDEDSTVDLEVRADIESQEDNFSATSTGVFVDALSIDFVDGQDDDQTTSDSTNGGNIKFGTTGIDVELSGTPTATVEYGQFSGDNDRGVFTIVFKVTAFGDDDIYIGGEGTTGSSNAGITYTLSSSSAVTVTKAELTSTAEEGDNSTFVVNSGDTETFTFTVEVQDASTSAADVAQRVTITGIKWDTDDDATPDNTYNSDLTDFKTPSKTI